ncbi:MAG: cyclase family protein [Candidatus Aminicenantes bacterium]|jgi:kynurenine formamidase
MNIIDLSHTISPGMPVYPGDDPPVFTTRAEIEEDGFVEKSITLGSHAGTHIDAPAHIIPYAPTLDRMPVDRFVGQGSVIDLTGMKSPQIDTSFLNPYEPLFKTSEFILLHTGWGGFWGQEKYFRNYPILSIEAALWVRSFGLKGIGVDALSVDELEATDLPIHKILLERMLIIENLTNLEKLPKTGFTFSCYPLKLENADASPVRAVAII